MTNSDSSGDSEDCEDIQPVKLNPFLIPHIVQRILSYCKFDDLKQTRLVCKLWLDCGTHSFSPRKTLLFKNFDHFDTFTTLLHYRNFEPTLCRNISLDGPDFPWIVLLKVFFSKYGTFIKSINISQELGELTEILLYQIAHHLESLEELSISGTTVVYSDDTVGGGGLHFHRVLPTVKIIKLKLPATCFKRMSDMKSFFTDFFAMFPNVESIQFLGCQFPELFKYLPDSMGFSKLHEIHLELLNLSGLQHFMRRGFLIDKMVLEIDPLLGLDNLHNFLASFSHSLKHLDLRFHYKGIYNYSHNATAFPSSPFLQELRTLRLFGYWGHLYFLKEMKSLKSVTVEKMNWTVAFPRGTEEVGESQRKILKFFDECGVYHSLNY